MTLCAPTLAPSPIVRLFATPTCRAQHDIVLEHDAARNSGLRDQHAMTADDDIVADLDLVVDLGALADDGIAEARRDRSQVPAPISTSSWMITRPICGTCDARSGLIANPNPSWPI